MLAFQRGGTQVLVATTVIEVGVDVPEGDHHRHRARGAVSASRNCTSCGDASDAARSNPPASCSTKGPLGRNGQARISIPARERRRFPSRRGRPEIARRGAGFSARASPACRVSGSPIFPSMACC